MCGVYVVRGERRTGNDPLIFDMSCLENGGVVAQDLGAWEVE